MIKKADRKVDRGGGGREARKEGGVMGGCSRGGNSGAKTAFLVEAAAREDVRLVSD